ncbi:MAG: glycosyltransferase family 2 protein [Paludibacteraceae bacterium]|nr:glycosyltransferase family 2 protein [Paludibacteraceae bacterium]
MYKGKVSIVVPVYKSEKTIHRCVDSILNQTYDNFELLLVDDGSPDKSGRICDEYALADTRVKVFHKENGGVSSARNLGIDNVQGEYLVFVDSDDYVGQDYLSHLLQVESSQFVVAGIHRSMDNIHACWEPREGHSLISDDLKNVWSKENNLYIYIFPTAKLFLTEIVKQCHIRFDTKIFYSEDFCFVMDYMAKIRSFDLIKVHDYNYIIPREEVNRAEKYKMNADQTFVHYEAVESRMQVLDRLSGVELKDMRNNVYCRLFKNFLTYLHGLDNKKSVFLELRRFMKLTHGTDFYKYATLHYTGKERIYYKVVYGVLTLISSF